jgi:hypothetical protein
MMLLFRDFLSHELIVVFVFVLFIVMKICLFSVGAMVDCCTFDEASCRLDCCI